MHRHAFSNGAYPSQGGGTFSIQPHKYVSQPPSTAQCFRNIFLYLLFPTTIATETMALTRITITDSSRDHSPR
jgi:hypothetical protein